MPTTVFGCPGNRIGLFQQTLWVVQTNAFGYADNRVRLSGNRIGLFRK